MAVASSALTTTGDNVDRTSYSSVSITPTANRLVLAWVYSIAAAAPNTPTASGNGLTWVAIDNQLDSDGLRRITLFRALGASPSAGAVTFSFGGQTQTGAAWSIIEYSGIDTSGTNGSGAIVQSAKNSTAGSATSLTVTLAAFSSVNNATAGGFGIPLNTASQPTAGSGFTRTGQVNQATPNLSIGSEFLASNDTTVDMTSGAASIPWAGIAVEIAVSGSTTTSTSISVSTSSTSSSTSISTSSTSSSISTSSTSTSISTSSTSTSISTSSTSSSTSTTTVPGQTDRIWSSGFESNSTVSGVEWDSSDGSPVIQSSVARSGSGPYALQITNLASTVAMDMNHILGSAGSQNGPLFFRQYYRVDTLPSAENRIIVWNDQQDAAPSHIIYITIDNGGLLRLYDEDGQIGSASSALSTATWYRIEMRYDRSGAAGSHIVRARIDGVEFAGASNRSLGAGLGAFAVGGNLNNEAQTTGNWYFDDTAINTLTYPGPGNIIHRYPNATGDANGFLVQVGGTAGAANNYTRVNELPSDDATSYNGSAVLNAEDLFNTTNSGIGASDIVNVVQIGVRMADLVSVDATAAFKVEVEKTSGGTKSQSSALIPNSTAWLTNAPAPPMNHPLTLAKDPDSNDWTQATLDSMQIGYTQIATNVQTIAISNIWALIEYQPQGTTTSTSSSTSISTSSTSTSVSTSSTSSSISTSVSTSTSISTSTSSTSQSTSISTSSTSSSISTSSTSNSTSTSSTSSSISTSSTSTSKSTSTSSTSQSTSVSTSASTSVSTSSTSSSISISTSSTSNSTSTSSTSNSTSISTSSTSQSTSVSTSSTSVSASTSASTSISTSSTSSSISVSTSTSSTSSSTSVSTSSTSSSTSISVSFTTSTSSTSNSTSISSSTSSTSSSTSTSVSTSSTSSSTSVSTSVSTSSTSLSASTSLSVSSTTTSTSTSISTSSTSTSISTSISLSSTSTSVSSTSSSTSTSTTALDINSMPRATIRPDRFGYHTTDTRPRVGQINLRMK